MAQKRGNTITIKSTEIVPVIGKAIEKKPRKKPLPKGLTEKQKAFCREYSYDWNATRSYLIAYPNTKNPNTAAVLASRMLRNDKVQAYISEIQKDLEKLSGISKKMVLDEHKKLAFSSIAHLHDTWITRKAFEDLTDEQKACISEISTQIRTIAGDEDHVPIQVEYVKIKLYDKQKALESISKMLGYDAPTKTALTDKNGDDVIPMIVFKRFSE